MSDHIVSRGKTKTNERLYECPFCSTEIKVGSNVFYGQCPTCKMTLIDFQPEPYQLNFHKSKAVYRLNIGGFGSGKTTMCCAELARHVLTVPHGKSLITGPKLQQMKDTVIPTLKKFLPKHLIEKDIGTPNVYIKMTNGHEIVLYASNDEENLRSLELTAFYVEEASNVDLSVFTQLRTRLRNPAGIIYDELGRDTGETHFMGLVSTNPDDGWVRSDFLLMSGKIFTSASIDRSIYDQIRVRNPEPEFHSFLSSSRDNTHLPKNFIRTVCIGRPASWIRKYIDCYLDTKEGAVYPDFAKALVAPIPVDPMWQRVVGFDKGFRDETSGLFLVLNPKDRCIYAYMEYYVKEQPVTYHAEQFKAMMKDLQLYKPIQADPTVRQRSDRDGISYQAYFQQRSGLYLDPANNDIIAGIEKVRDYIYTGKLKIFNTLENLKAEASNYAWQEGKELPVDKRNHLLDCLRYAIACLPDNPLDMNAVSFQAQEVKNFWGDKWDEDDGTYTSGGVTLTQGGLLNDD